MPFSAAAGFNGYGKDSLRLPLTLVNHPETRPVGFVYKYTSTGQLLWTARIASTSGNRGVTRAGLDRTTCVYGTATDSTGAVYATGEWYNDDPGGSRVAGSLLVFYNSDGSYGGTLFGKVPTTTRMAFLAKYNAGGRFQWASYVITPLTADTLGAGRAVAVDPFDNVYMAGSVGPSRAALGAVVTAYNANGTAFGTTFAAAGSDAFLVKYNSSGTVQWLTRVSTTNVNDDNVGGLAANSSAVYMTGYSGSAIAYNANGTSGASFTITGGCAFIAVYNLEGTVQWFTRLGTAGALSGRKLFGYGAALDGSGSLLVVGTYSSNALTAFNANGTAFSPTLTPTGNDNFTAFLAKYNSAGTVQWITRLTTSNTLIYAVCTDASNSIYVAGDYLGTTTTGVAAYNANGTLGLRLSQPGSNNAYVVKYNTAGFAQWGANVVGAAPALEAGNAVTTDASNNVYLLANTAGTAPYTVDIQSAGGSTFSTQTVTTSNASFLTQYSTDGVAQWVRQFPFERSYALCRDCNMNLYAGGTSQRYTAPPAPGPSASVALTLANSGGTDAIVVKYTTNGAPMWAARIASTGTDIAYATATDSTGMIYVTGTVGAATGTVFNANGTAFATTIPASRGFLVKYSPAGVVQWVVSFTTNAGLGGKGVSIDSTGAVYVAASAVPSSSQFIAYNADGTAGITQSTLTTTSAGALLLKYSSAGTAQWISRIVSTNACEYYAVAVGPSDVVVVAGLCRSGATAYSADGTSFGTITNSGGSDAIVVNYTSGGTIQWIARMASSTADAAEAVACDLSGNIYVGGWGGDSTGAVTIFNANGTSFSTLPTPPGIATVCDGFLVKYTGAGVAQWGARYTSTGFERTRGLATDSDGNIYLAGEGDRLTFYDADGTTNKLQLMTGNNQIGCLAKYTPAGVVEWTAGFDAAGNDVAYAVATDLRRNVYVGGRLAWSATTGSIVDINTPPHLYTAPFSVLKFTHFGAMQWYQSLKGATTFATTFGLAIDFDSNVIVVGSSGIGESTNIYAMA